MSRFLSLSPADLPEDFDLEQHSGKPLVTVNEEQDRIDIDYIFSGFSLGIDDQKRNEKTLAFREIGIPGVGFISESGKPLLPSFGRFVQIPPGCDYNISVQLSDPVNFDNILVTPAQEQATDSTDDEDEFEFDATAYASDKLYPAEVVLSGEPQNLDDYKVIAIHVRPLQYNAAKRQLIGYSNVHITVDLNATATDAESPSEFPQGDPTVNREGYGNLILNPRRHIAERIPVNDAPAPVVEQPRGPELLIIYDEPLREAAEQLAAWKNRKGLLTETVSIAAIGNTADMIKTNIRSKRGFYLSRLRYVLLFGDVAAITAEERSNNTTDHYYFTKKDAISDNECILPWISGGRIPTANLEDAKAVVQQIIDYERTPPVDPDYYRNMTFAAYFQDNDPQDGQANRAYMKTMESIRKHMTSLGFNVERVYVSNNANPLTYKDGSQIPAEVREAIISANDATAVLIEETQAGQLAIGHRDHGSEKGWAHPPFKKEHLQALQNCHPSIFYSINCLTGRFDYTPSDSFAERIMELKGGAPSLIAATEKSGTWRNDSLMKALFDATWPGVIGGFPGSNASYAIKHNRLGDILNYAKSYLLVAHGINAGVKDHLEIYHVIGDPTLELWADEPTRIRLRAHVGHDKLNIHVNPAPAEAVVTIWDRDRLIKRAALASRRISIAVDELRMAPEQPDRPRHFLHVCVSAPGCRFTQTRVRL